MQEKARIFKSNWCYSRLLNHFSKHKKWPILFLRIQKSPVKASNFNPLNPDLLTLYRLPNPIKIWPTYAVLPTKPDQNITNLRCTPAQHTTCAERGHSQPFFNRLRNVSRSPRPLRVGSTNPCCMLRSPRSRPAHCWSVHFSRAGESGGWSVLWSERDLKARSHQRWSGMIPLSTGRMLSGDTARLSAVQRRLVIFWSGTGILKHKIGHFCAYEWIRILE